jgi:hypothetical protein
MNAGRQRLLCTAALSNIYKNQHVQRRLYVMPENPSTPILLSHDLALDESLYNLTEEERTFFKQQTGIPDDDELKAHIFRVQAEAYGVCICQLEPSEKKFMTEII